MPKNFRRLFLGCIKNYFNEYMLDALLDMIET
jgi:hypothetical protein